MIVALDFQRSLNDIQGILSVTKVKCWKVAPEADAVPLFDALVPKSRKPHNTIALMSVRFRG